MPPEGGGEPRAVGIKRRPRRALRHHGIPTPAPDRSMSVSNSWPASRRPPGRRRRAGPLRPPPHPPTRPPRCRRGPGTHPPSARAPRREHHVRLRARLLPHPVGARISGARPRPRLRVVLAHLLEGPSPPRQRHLARLEVPYFALSSGTTSGATKYIPVYAARWSLSNRKAAFTTIALFRHAYPEAKLFTGKFFFLGGSTDLRSRARRQPRRRPQRHRRPSRRRRCGRTRSRRSTSPASPTGRRR